MGSIRHSESHSLLSGAQRDDRVSLGLIRRTVPVKQNLGQIEELAYEEDPAGAKGQITRELGNTETRKVVYRDNQGKVISEAQMQKFQNVDVAKRNQQMNAHANQNLQTIQMKTNNATGQESGGTQLVSKQMEQNSGQPRGQVHRKVVTTLTQTSTKGESENQQNFSNPANQASPKTQPNQTIQTNLKIINEGGQIKYANQTNIEYVKTANEILESQPKNVTLKPKTNSGNEYRTENQITNILLSHNQPKLISGLHSKVIRTETNFNLPKGTHREAPGISKNETTSEIIFQNSVVDPKKPGQTQNRQNNQRIIQQSSNVHRMFYNDPGTRANAKTRKTPNQAPIISSQLISQEQANKIISTRSKSPNKQKRTKITQNRVITREVTVKKVEQASPQRETSPLGNQGGHQRTNQTINQRVHQVANPRINQVTNKQINQVTNQQIYQEPSQSNNRVTVLKGPVQQNKVITTGNKHARQVTNQRTHSRSPVRQVRTISPVHTQNQIPRHPLQQNPTINRQINTIETQPNVQIHRAPVQRNIQNQIHRVPVHGNVQTQIHRSPVQENVQTQIYRVPVQGNVQTRIHKQVPVHGNVQTQMHRQVPTTTQQTQNIYEFSGNRFRHNTNRFEEVINRSAAFTFKNGSFKTGKKGHQTTTITTRIPDQIQNASPTQEDTKRRMFNSSFQMKPKKPMQLEAEDHIKIDNFILIQNRKQTPTGSQREINRINQNFQRSRTPAKRTPQTVPTKHAQTHRVIQKSVRSVSPFRPASPTLPITQKQRFIKRSVPTQNTSEVQRHQTNRTTGKNVTVRRQLEQRTLRVEQTTQSKNYEVCR